MSPWVAFVACFALTAFVAVTAAVVRSAGYTVGGEDQ